MKKSVLFSALVLTSALRADSDSVAATQKADRPTQQPMNDNNMMMNRVVLTSARPESDNGWYLFADALYWHADVGQTDWAIKYPNETQTVLATNVHSLDFKWNWGFKVGVGVNMDHDMWDSSFSYTWFRTENSNRAGVVPGTGRVRDNLGIFTYSSTGKIKWDIKFNMFDWELGRWHYVSKDLALRPHVGVKGGWINQTVNLNFTQQAATGSEPYRAVEKFQNDFWGVGPSAGINTLWVLGSAGSQNDHRFSLFGDFGGALMYGHFNVKNNQKFTLLSGATSGGYNFSKLSRNMAVTMLQGIMGFSWDTGFNRGRNHFMMRVGYELQYWFRQNQLFSMFRTTLSGDEGATNTRGSRLSDDLALQGLTVDFRFDF